jgi:hypothetical protein
LLNSNEIAAIIGGFFVGMTLASDEALLLRNTG